MTTISLKLHLYPTDKQSNLLEATMEQYRLACNLVSNYYFDHIFKPKQADLQKSLYHLIRNKFGLKAQMTQSVFKTVLARYKAVNSQISKKPYKYQDKNTWEWYKEKRDLTWLQKPIPFATVAVALIGEPVRLNLSGLKELIVAIWEDFS